MLVEFIDFIWCHVGVLLQVRLDVDIPNVGAGVEKLREEANPCKELDFTDFACLGW